MPEAIQPRAAWGPWPPAGPHPDPQMPMVALPPSVPQPRPIAALLAAGLTLAAGAWMAPLKAAPQPGPMGGEAPRSCPALLPKSESFLEPMRLRPAEVPAKNARGCLSPGDAIYGPDGCPKKLCPQPQGLGL